jgi:hypothetical protein
MKARSLPELFEISAAHSQRQMRKMTEQAQEIADTAQKIASQSARPFGRGFSTST